MTAPRAVALAVLCFTLKAQPPVPPAETTVVTVTGQATPVSATSASVVVLTRQSVESASAGNAGDLLRQLPFLYVARFGAIGGQTAVTLRGGKPNFTMVMFDGIPLNDITNVLGGSYDFSTMSSDAIDQVEIVRGPLSSVYGSDAVAGVINIIPRRGEDNPSMEFEGSFGSFLTRDTGASAFGKIKNFDYGFSGSWFDIAEQVKNDPFRLGTLIANSHGTFGAEKAFRLVARYQNAEVSGLPPGGGGPEFSILQFPQAVHTIELASGAGWKQQVNQKWLYGIEADVFRRTQNANIPPLLDAVPPTARSIPSEATNTDFQRFRLGASNTLRLGGDLTAEFGAGWKWEDGSSTGSLAGIIPDKFSLIRHTGDANGVLNYSTRRLNLTAGMRLDKSTDFRAVYSPSVGISYRALSRRRRLHATWGRGFKLPSFYAVADRIVGNPFLKPEFTRSFDAGIEDEFLKGRVRAALTIFRSDFTDLVDFSAQVFRLVNRSEARTQGAELSLAAPLSSRLEFRVQTSYLEWRLQNTTEPLRNTPHWQSGGGIDWRITRRWNSHVEVLGIGPRYDFQVPVPQQLVAGGYFTANAASSYEVSPRLTVFARVDNLLDRRYHEYIGFPNPGMYARGGIRLRFQ
jgi:outer membrane cobalamin receptor